MQALTAKLEALEQRDQQLEVWRRAWDRALAHFHDLIRKGLSNSDLYRLRREVLDPNGFPALTLEMANVPGRIFFKADQSCVSEQGELLPGRGFITCRSRSIRLYQWHTVGEGEGGWYIDDSGRPDHHVPIEEGLEEAILSLISDVV